MHPLTIAASRDQTRSPEVGKVPRDFRLVSVQNLHEKTDADLIVSNQVDDTQSSSIRESFKQQFYAVLFAFHFLFFPGLCLPIKYDLDHLGVPSRWIYL
jgi:hypothetical protein